MTLLLREKGNYERDWKLSWLLHLWRKSPKDRNVRDSFWNVYYKSYDFVIAAFKKRFDVCKNMS